MSFSQIGIECFEESKKERRQSKSDSDTSCSEELRGSSQGSLDWCSSVGPLNWADEVDAEFTDSGDELLNSPSLGARQVEVEHVDYSAPNSPEVSCNQDAMKYRKFARKDLSKGKQFAIAPVKNVPRRGQLQYSWADGCAGAVLQLLQEHGPNRSSVNLGWEALQRIWNVGPPNLDHAVLSCLSAKPPRSQEHILLSFAAIDLSNVKNLSAYLNCLVKEHDTTRQVCLYFLAGLCTEDKACTWVHPVNTKGWDSLRDSWQITYKDLDYTVLNFLCKKNTEEQDNILTSLAGMDLRGIHNLSAYLSSMIQKHGCYHHSSSMAGRRPEGKRGHGGRHGQGPAYPCTMSPVLSPELLPMQDMPIPEMMSPVGSPPYYPPYMPHHCMGPPPLLPPYGAPYMMRPYLGYGDEESSYPTEPCY